MKTRRGVEVDKRGCFISMIIVAAMLLGAGWLFGEFLLAPVHCHSAVCEQWAWHLHLAVVSSFVGLGCLLLAGLNVRPGVVLPLGVGILLLTALTGLSNLTKLVVAGVDFLLVVAVGGWFLAGWMDA